MFTDTQLCIIWIFVSVFMPLYEPINTFFFTKCYSWEKSLVSQCYITETIHGCWALKPAQLVWLLFVKVKGFFWITLCQFFKSAGPRCNRMDWPKNTRIYHSGIWIQTAEWSDIYLRPPGRIKNQPTNKNNNLKEKNIHIAKLKLAKHAGCAHGGGLLLKDICWLHSLGRPGGEEPGSETCKEIETRRWLLKEHGTRTLAASHSEHEGVKMPPLCFTQLREPEIQSKDSRQAHCSPGTQISDIDYSFFSLPL